MKITQMTNIEKEYMKKETRELLDVVVAFALIIGGLIILFTTKVGFVKLLITVLVFTISIKLNKK